MILQTKRERRQVRELIRSREFEKMLEALLALDRTLVELSMRFYKIPRRHQVAMREQNRRLHTAVRARLSQF